MSLEIRPGVMEFAHEMLNWWLMRFPSPSFQVLTGFNYSRMTIDEKAFVDLHKPGVEVYVGSATVSPEDLLKDVIIYGRADRLIQGRAFIDRAQMPGFVDVSYQSGVSMIRETVAQERLYPLPATRIAAAAWKRGNLR
jgi:hypothetical protein